MLYVNLSFERHLTVTRFVLFSSVLSATTGTVIISPDLTTAWLEVLHDIKIGRMHCLVSLPE
jgi:hypothetical protein